MKYFRIWLSLVAIAMVLTNCKKDENLSLTHPGPKTEDITSGVRGVSIEKAKVIYESAFDAADPDSPISQFGATDENGCVIFEPIWFLANEVAVDEGDNIIIVPVEMPPNVATPGKGMQLVFFANDTCDYPMELVIYEAQDPAQTDNCTFSGPVVTFNYCDCTALKYYVEDGTVYYADNAEIELLPTCSTGIDQRNKPKCYNFNGGGFWGSLGNFFNTIGGWFSGSSGNSGNSGNGGSGGGVVWNTGSGFPNYHPGTFYNNNPPSGGGGSSPVVIETIFDGTFFNGQGQTVIYHLDQILADNDLFVCLEELHQALYHCIATQYANDPANTQCGGFHPPAVGNEPPPSPTTNELTIQQYITWLNNNLGNAPSCLDEVIQSYQGNINTEAGDGGLICWIEEANDYGISDEELFDLIQENGCYENNNLSEDCICEAYTESVFSNLILPTDPSAYEQLIEYITDIRNACTHRCTDYGDHADFLDNWLYIVETNPSVITTYEVYDMGLWCKKLRDDILANHLLQFGMNVLDVLEVAAWEYDLFVAQRFFSAVPTTARSWGMTRIISNLDSPISSFSAWQYAQKFGINSYDELVTVFNQMGWSRSQKGVQFHHVVEQRFAGKAGVNQWLGGSNTGNWESIVLTDAEHIAITNNWRTWIPYSNQAPGPLGVNTTTAQISHIEDAAREIYKDFPEILQALGI